MTEELFKKIVDDLASIGYKDTLTLHCNNEPFLDDRIIEFAKYARGKLPNAYISIWTNGSLLTVEKVKNIMPYLNDLTIDNYNDNLELNDPVKPIYELTKTDSDLNQRIRIALRKQNEVLYSRGGQAPNKGKVKSLNVPCLHLFRQMVIRPDGKVSLCCNDALGKYTLGDLNKQTVKEVWLSGQRDNIVKNMLKGRQYIELCKYCDTFTF